MFENYIFCGIVTLIQIVYSLLGMGLNEVELKNYFIGKHVTYSFTR